jgi:hypothetical protein
MHGQLLPPLSMNGSLDELSNGDIWYACCRGNKAKHAEQQSLIVKK